MLYRILLELRLIQAEAADVVGRFVARSTGGEERASGRVARIPTGNVLPPGTRPTRSAPAVRRSATRSGPARPLTEHNTWKWWTPIQPFYAKRGIALHQHTEVTGQPIGHGCMRMADENAKRIFDYSNGKRTIVTIDGRAAPVLCEKDQRCNAGGGTGALHEQDEDLRMASQPPVPGLEGVLT